VLTASYQVETCLRQIDANRCNIHVDFSATAPALLYHLHPCRRPIVKWNCYNPTLVHYDAG
jgi:hypothetical protein